MAKFGELLSELIRQKKYSIRALAAEIGMPATTLIKLCNGSRSLKKPNDKIEKLIHILMLTPEEQQQLEGALQEEILGKDVYESRQNVKAILENLSLVGISPHLAKMQDLDDNMVAERKIDVSRLLCIFLENAAGKQERVDMIFQPSDVAIMEDLCHAIKTWPVRLRHLFALSTAESAKSRLSASNIEYIRQVMPMLFGQSVGQYEGYYYYERSLRNAGSGLMFDNIFLAGESVLLCTQNFDGAIYLKNPELHTFLQGRFNQQFSKSHSLSHSERNMIAQLGYQLQIAQQAEPSNEIAIVSWQPCLMRFVNPSDAEAYMPAEIPFRQEILDKYFSGYWPILRKRKRFVLYCSAEGAVDFASTGIIREIAGTILNGALPKEFRRLLFSRLLSCARSGEVELHFFRESYLKLSKNALVIYFGSETLCVGALDQTAAGGFCFFEECGLAWSVLDFLENLEPEKEIFSNEESCRGLEVILQRYLEDIHTSPSAAATQTPE